MSTPVGPARRPVADPAREALTLEGVGYSYPGRPEPVLERLDLELAPGEITALVGPSGCGKSTIARLLMRLADPDEGAVRCGGGDLREMDLRGWRSRIAWVPQRPQLFTGTVEQNLLLGGAPADPERIARALRESGAEEFVAQLPDGPETLVGEGGRRLSVGQRQRLALARALLRDARLLILDEPTAHLDDSNTGRIADSLAAIGAGRTTLLIVHHPALAEQAHHVCRLAAEDARRGNGGRVSSRAPGPLRSLGALPAGERSRLGLAVVLAVGAMAAAIGLLATSGYLISRAAQRPQILELMVVIVAVRAFGLLRALLRYGERLASHDLALRQLARLRVRFFERLAPLVPGSLRHRQGELLARFVADVDTLADLYLRALIPTVVAAGVILGAAFAAWLMLPIAGLVTLLALMAAAIAVPWLTTLIGLRADRRQGVVRAALLAELVQSIDGAEELIMCGRGEEQIARLSLLDGELTKLFRRDGLAVALAETLGGLITAAGLLAVLLVGIQGVQHGALAGVLLAALAFLFLASYEAVAPLPAAARSLRACAQAAGRVQEVCELDPAVSEPPVARRVTGSGALRAEGIDYRYSPQEPWLLQDFELEIGAGERVALLGPSGSGKSTLAELLVRFRDPDAGKVTLDGVDLRLLPQDELRRSVLLCGQDVHLFNTTIRENLLIARREAGEAELSQVLGAVELTDWVAGLPEGLDTRVGAEGSRLSGGQRQRLAVARALLSEARFLILDEPTAHLEDELARRIGRRVIEDRRSGQGLLLITHDRLLAEACERIVELAPPGRAAGPGVGKTRNRAGFPGLREGRTRLVC